MLLDVTVVSPQKVVYEGKAKSVTLPGESGVFEILPFHHSILSRLIAGVLFIDGTAIPVARGIAGVTLNKVNIIVETE